MCRKVGITGRVDLRPYITLSESERAWAAPTAAASPSRAAASGAGSSCLNKQWQPERFAEVAAHLMRSHPGRPDRRHRRPRRAPAPTTSAAGLSLRQLAGLLSHCRMFVGLVGMPMHMARAVDCPSVIVYGGRERPDQTGYICNENIYNAVPCAPCWLDSRCEFGRVCMETIPTAVGDRGRRADAGAAPREPRRRVLRDPPVIGLVPRAISSGPWGHARRRPRPPVQPSGRSPRTCAGVNPRPTSCHADPDEPLDLDALRYEPLAGRPSKVRLADLGRPGTAPGRWRTCWPRCPTSWPGVGSSSSATRSSPRMPAAGRCWPRSAAT